MTPFLTSTLIFANGGILLACSRFSILAVAPSSLDSLLGRPRISIPIGMPMRAVSVTGDKQISTVTTEPVIAVTEARLVNTLTSTSLTSRSRVISALGRYNQKCGVENEFVGLRNVQILGPAVKAC